jgi:hypothetical protein
VRTRTSKTTSRKKRILFSAVAIAAVAAGTVGATSYAQADDLSTQASSAVRIYYGSGPGHDAMMTHNDDGDRFIVEDAASDGYGVYGYLLGSTGAVLDSVYNGNGAGSDFESFGYDIKTGYSYTMKICLVDGPNHTKITCEKQGVTE